MKRSKTNNVEEASFDTLPRSSAPVDEEDDPLDAFMATIETKVSKNQPNFKGKKVFYFYMSFFF